MMPYSTPKGLGKSLLRAMWRRPVVQVRFGDPVDLFGLSGTSGAQATQATRLIIQGIDRTLLPLRVDEPRTPRHVDTTRPMDLSRVRSREELPVG
jgi:hypothetical protein